MEFKISTPFHTLDVKSSGQFPGLEDTTENFKILLQIQTAW